MNKKTTPEKKNTLILNIILFTSLIIMLCSVLYIYHHRTISLTVLNSANQFSPNGSCGIINKTVDKDGYCQLSTNQEYNCYMVINCSWIDASIDIPCNTNFTILEKINIKSSLLYMGCNSNFIKSKQDIDYYWCENKCTSPFNYTKDTIITNETYNSDIIKCIWDCYEDIDFTVGLTKKQTEVLYNE